MSHPTLTRWSARSLAVGGMAALAAVSLAACGDEQQSGAQDSSAAPSVTTPSTSVPVVAGPSPQSRTTEASSGAQSASTSSTSKTCGSVAGPDGALRVLVLAGDVDCETAKKVGTEYSPKIATGQQQKVSGWTCGPSEVRGILAACQSGDKVVGFTP